MKRIEKKLLVFTIFARSYKSYDNIIRITRLWSPNRRVQSFIHYVDSSDRTVSVSFFVILLIVSIVCIRTRTQGIFKKIKIQLLVVRVVQVQYDSGFMFIFDNFFVFFNKLTQPNNNNNNKNDLNCVLFISTIWQYKFFAIYLCITLKYMHSFLVNCDFNRINRKSNDNIYKINKTSVLNFK